MSSQIKHSCWPAVGQLFELSGHLGKLQLQLLGYNYNKYISTAANQILLQSPYKLT